MSHWLFKTEPSEYSYADLARDKRAVWEGVSNALALIHLRNVRAGDSVVLYHTGGEKAAVGLARVARGPYPDPRLGDPRRVVVDLVPDRAFAHAVPLDAFRADRLLATTELVRISRLSVMPLPPAAFERVLALGDRGPVGAPGQEGLEPPAAFERVLALGDRGPVGAPGQEGLEPLAGTPLRGPTRVSRPSRPGAQGKRTSARAPSEAAGRARARAASGAAQRGPREPIESAPTRRRRPGTKPPAKRSRA